MKTKLNSSLITLLACATLSFSSCKNESESISLLANPTSAGFKELRKNALADITQTKSFKAEEGLTFETNKGTKISILPNCLRDISNANVSGDVNLSIVEMYDGGNMAITNKALMGKDNLGNLKPLITGGQFNIQVTKGSEALSPGCPFYVNVPASLTGGLDEQMKLWFGEINEDGNLEWELNDGENGQGKRAGMNPNSESATYDIWSNQFGWTNVDRFSGDPDPKTQIKVTVPEGYNHTNSAVYLSYVGEKNMLAQLDTYDNVEHYFSEHYGFLPVGKGVHIIFTSESNGSIVYAIKTVNIAASATYNFSTDEFKITAKDNLVNIINNLN